MKAQLEDGYTKIANGILESLSLTHLSPYEWQVIMTIFRKTYGFNKKSDWISLSQISEATGMKKSHASRSLGLLIKRKIVTPGGKGAFSINTDVSTWVKLPRGVTSHHLPRGVKVVTPGGNLVLPRGGYTKETTTKETITKEKRKLKEKNDVTENDFEQIAQHYQVPKPFVISKWEDVCNWELEKPGRMRGRDWRMTLMNWVKRDAIKIKGGQNAGRTVIDARGIRR